LSDSNSLRCSSIVTPSSRTRSNATAASSPPNPASDHSRAVWALVIVSSVVKVFEEITNRVSSGSRSRVSSAKSVPSTLETKRKLISRRL